MSKLTVEFRGLAGPDATDTVFGTLSWDGQSWSSTGEPWIAEIPQKPIWAKGQRLVASDNPATFLEHLPHQFTGAYCRATAPTKTE